MQEQEQNRTEQATPYKLAEARRQGQVAKSLEFNTLVMFLALLATLAIFGANHWRALCELCEQLLSSGGILRFTTDTTPFILGDLGVRVTAILLPFLLAGTVAAIFANVVQTGPVFSFAPLKPQFDRLNPATGFKRVWNARMLFEACKSLVKLFFFVAIAYAFFLALLPDATESASFVVVGLANWLGTAGLALLLRLGAGLLIVGIIDLAYTRWRFGRQMMMSRRELKEELKRREGDPQIRSRIRELQRENLRQARSMGRLPDADVLITNPDHYAVALRYDRRTMHAPALLAKGRDHWANEMKTVARRHGVPIVERRSLARSLFRHGVIEQPIPAECFLDVARVYADLAAERRASGRYEVVRS